MSRYGYYLLYHVVLLFTHCQHAHQSEVELHYSDVATIDEIFLIYRHGESIHLKQHARGAWRLNSKYLARTDAVNNFLQTVRHQRIQSIPPRAVAESIIKDIAVFGTKVELYTAGKKIKTFYVGGVTPDELGTHMMLEGNDQPYIMHLPGFQGSLRTRYVMNEDEWRDRSLLPFALDSLIQVEVNYPQNDAEGFKIKKERDQWQLSSPARYQAMEIAPNTNLLQAYLTELFSAGIESYDNKNPNKLQLSQGQSFFELICTFKQGKVYTLHFMPAKTDQNPRGEIYIFTSDNDFCLAQERVLNKLFVGYDYFFR